MALPVLLVILVRLELLLLFVIVPLIIMMMGRLRCAMLVSTAVIPAFPQSHA